MTQNLTGEIVVITGASSGIGKAVAEEVASEGGTPVLLSRYGKKLESVSKSIYMTYGIFAPFYPLDVTNNDDISVVFRQIYRDLGDIDVLINNAGFAIFDYAAEASMKDADEMYRVNVSGSAAASKAVLPYMKIRGKGHIIFVASLAGKVATPKAGFYSATKHAVIGFANALRLEYANTPINVSVVNPGPVKTNFFSVADATGDYEKNVEKIMLNPETVASQVVKLINKPKRELNIPKWMALGAVLYQLFPGTVEKLAERKMNSK